MKKEILEKMFNSKKNLIVSGDISTGKTENVVFPVVEEIINNNQSLLVLDSKEEYINKYYDKLKEKNYNIFTFKFIITFISGFFNLLHK